MIVIVININSNSKTNTYNDNNKAPNELSLLGWLMGRALDTYKMSHKARAIYRL